MCGWKNICRDLNRVPRATGDLIDEQGGFRMERRCVDQIFTLKQIGEKRSVCWFYRFGEDV